MRLSNRGLLEIAEHEGIVPAPYMDSQGYWTFGIGHTAFAGEPDPQEMPGRMPRSEQELEKKLDRALSIFREDVVKYEDRVRRALQVPVEQHEFDALVSFDFNTGGIFRAKLTKAINGGDPDASRHFMGWLRPPEIKKRRMAEKRLFETGNYDANGDQIPVWKTDGKGRLIGIYKVMSGSELLERLGVTRPPEIPPEEEQGCGLWRCLRGLFRKGA